MLKLSDALLLASILEKYIDEKSMERSNDVSVVDFIARIIDRISPREYLQAVILLTGETEETISKQLAIDTLTAFIEGLKENQVLALVSFYQSLGFK